MTKHDYELIARVIREAQKFLTYTDRANLCDLFINALEAEIKRFDPNKFADDALASLTGSRE